MTENVKWLLTDEYVAFAKKISEVLDRKKEKEAELKAFYDKVKTELKECEAVAEALQQEWEAFKAEKENGS